MKNNQKRIQIRKIFAKHWVKIWLIAASVFLLTILTVWGAYTNTDQKMKRVVAPSASSGGLFTSNYLKLGSNAIETAFFDADSVSHSYNVIIRNHDPSDPETMFNGSIPYTLTASLAHKDGSLYNSNVDSVALSSMTSSNMYISISFGTDTITLNGSTLNGSSSSHTLSKTAGNHENTWTVTYSDNIPLGSDFCVRLVAEPAASTNLDSLSATIIIDSYPVPNPEGWSCELVESGNIDDFDAFNYTISGTGKKDLSFSYDSAKLIVNPACYQFSETHNGVREISEPVDYVGKAGWKTIVIHADPDTTLVNRYDFQVYKNDWQPSSINDITPNAKDNNNTLISYIEFKCE